MSRYGWAREQISPYSSITGGVPAVTDDDFSYITSQDLDDPGLGPSDRYNNHHRSHSAAPGPEDDVLLIKHKGVTYPAHFPAYAIGDGKLRVKDVRDRVGLLMDLSERATRHAKLLYKGRQLKEPAAPVREYGVKNKSELMAILSEEGYDGSSASEEEMVIVDAPRSGRKSSRKKKKSRKTDKDDAADSASSPRSNSTFEHSKSPPNKSPPTRSPRSPPSKPSPSPSPAPATTGPMKKLDELSLELNTKWLPMCDIFFTNPPADPKKRDDEHRKLTESLLQQILLKLDSVETDGIPEVRAKRKELVQKVQSVMKALDVTKAGP